MKPVPNLLRWLSRVSVAMLTALSLGGCSYDSDDPTRPFLMMSLHSPTGYDLDDWLVLRVPINGRYDAWQAGGPSLEGRLTVRERDDLNARLTHDTAMTLSPFAVDWERCERQQNDDAYLFMPFGWHMCIVPADVTGDAKPLVDYLVALFTKLTSSMKPLQYP